MDTPRFSDQSQALSNPKPPAGWDLLSLGKDFGSGLKDGALRPVDGILQLTGLENASKPPNDAQGHNSTAANIGSMIGQAFDFTVLDLAAKRIPGLGLLGRSGSAIAAGGALGFLSANDAGHNSLRDRIMGGALGGGTMAVMEGTGTLFGKMGLVGSLKKTVANNVLSGLVTGAVSTEVGTKVETGSWASPTQAAESAFSWAAVGGVLGGLSARFGRAGAAVSGHGSETTSFKAEAASGSRPDAVKLNDVVTGAKLGPDAAEVLQKTHADMPANQAQVLASVIDKLVSEGAEKGKPVSAADLVGRNFDAKAYMNAYNLLERSSERWAVISGTKEQWLSAMAFKMTRSFGCDWSAWLDAQPQLKESMKEIGQHDLGRIGSHADALPLSLIDSTPGLKELLLRNPQLSTAELKQISNHLESAVQANPAAAKWLLDQSDQSIQSIAKVWNSLPELPAPIALHFADSPELEKLAAKAAWQRVAPTLSDAERVAATSENFAASNQPAFSHAYDQLMAGGTIAIMNDANVVSLTAKQLYPHLTATETAKIARAAGSSAASDGAGLSASQLLTSGFDAAAFKEALTRLEGKPQQQITLDARTWVDNDRTAFGLANTFGKDWQQWLEPHINAEGKPLEPNQFSSLRFPAFATADLVPLKDFLLRSPDLKLSEVNTLFSRLNRSDKASYDALFQHSDADIRNVLSAWNIEPRLPIPLAIEYGGKRTLDLAAATVAFREATGLKPNAADAEPISLSDLTDAFKLNKIDSALDVTAHDSSVFDDLRARQSEVLARGKYAVIAQTQSLKAAVQVFHPKLSATEANYLEVAARNAEGRHPDTMSLVGANVKAGTFARVLKRLSGSQDTLPDDLTWQPVSALATTNIFGRDAEQWLAVQRRKGVDYHDATQWLPMYSPKEADGLGLFLLRNSERNERDLALVARRWGKMPDEMREMSFAKLVRSLREQTYKTAKSPALAAEAARWDVSEEEYYNYEARYLASLKTPSPFPTEKTWTSGGLEGRFLPRSDERGIFLGEHTNCCQHPANAGAACAWFGQESPKSGFFVVSDKAGNVVAQSWAWLADQGGLVFDSLESKGLGARADAVANIYQQAANDLSNQFGSVTLGKGTDRLNISRWPDAADETKPLPKSYGQKYSDAKQQVLLAKGGEGSSDRVVESPVRNPQDFVFDPYAASHAVRAGGGVLEAPQAVRGGAAPADAPQAVQRPIVQVGTSAAQLDAAESIAQKVYPDGYRYVSDGDTMLVLDLPGKGTVGYAALDLNSHEINDLAVLPQYRKYSTVLMRGLQQFIKEYDSHPGDVWTATLRQSTTDRLLNFYDHQGAIKILSRQPGESMNGEPMFDVSFTVN